MELSIQEKMAAQAIGMEVAKNLKKEIYQERLIQAIESAALQALEEIRHVLDDETLNDSECFRQIEAIVNVFEANGIDTTRHDW